MPMPVVPLIVDNAAIGDPPVTRCVYFSIVADNPMDIWGLNIQRYVAPFVMISLSGIIISSLRSDGIFGQPTDIEDVIELVEGQSGDGSLSIEIDSVLIPSGALDAARLRAAQSDDDFTKAVRGDVFRVDLAAFNEARKFGVSTGDVSVIVEQFKVDMDDSSSAPPRIIFSRSETVAFADWSRIQLS